MTKFDHMMTWVLKLVGIEVKGNRIDTSARIARASWSEEDRKAFRGWEHVD